MDISVGPASELIRFVNLDLVFKVDTLLEMLEVGDNFFFSEIKFLLSVFFDYSFTVIMYFMEPVLCSVDWCQSTNLYVLTYVWKYTSRSIQIVNDTQK